MDFLVYPTEKCNLFCEYCESYEDRKKFAQLPTYDIQLLKRFLRKAPERSVHFYGGEPLLNIKFISEILRGIKFKYATLQTNGLLLDRIPQKVLDKLDLITVSLDGTQETTDKFRGKGCYKKAIEQAKRLRERYKKPIAARMTVSPGVDIEKEVLHLLSTKDFTFDMVHWQLNALFHKSNWGGKRSR